MSELDLSHLIFPVIGRDPNENRNAHLQEGFHDGEPIPGTKCMERGCYEPRWKHPKTGETVLCHDHLYLVVFCGHRVPPLRQRLDYSPVGRKTFLVEQLPDGALPIYDSREPSDVTPEQKELEESMRKKLASALEALKKLGIDL